MKTVHISFFVAILVVLAISTDAQTEESAESDCPKLCTYDYRPVCGYNGTCYSKYGNQCSLKFERCNNEKNSNLKAVDMALCEEALAKSNPDVVECAQ